MSKKPLSDTEAKMLYDEYQARRLGRCCDSHHYEACCDGTPGCCPDCPINPWGDENGEPTHIYSCAVRPAKRSATHV